MQQGVVLKVRLKPFSQKAPQGIQLQCAAECGDDQAVAVLQLDLSLGHITSCLQSAIGGLIESADVETLWQHCHHQTVAVLQLDLGLGHTTSFPPAIRAACLISDSNQPVVWCSNHKVAKSLCKNTLPSSVETTRLSLCCSLILV